MHSFCDLPQPQINFIIVQLNVTTESWRIYSNDINELISYTSVWWMTWPRVVTVNEPDLYRHFTVVEWDWHWDNWFIIAILSLRRLRQLIMKIKYWSWATWYTRPSSVYYRWTLIHVSYKTVLSIAYVFI